MILSRDFSIDINLLSIDVPFKPKFKDKQNINLLAMDIPLKANGNLLIRKDFNSYQVVFNSYHRIPIDIPYIYIYEYHRNMKEIP